MSLFSDKIVRPLPFSLSHPRRPATWACRYPAKTQRSTGHFDSRYTRVRVLPLFVLHRFHSLGQFPIADFTRSCLKCRRRVFLWSQCHSMPWPPSPPTIRCLTESYKSQYKPVFALGTDLESRSGGRVCFCAQIASCMCAIAPVSCRMHGHSGGRVCPLGSDCQPCFA